MTEQHELILAPPYTASGTPLAGAVDRHYDPHTQLPGETLGILFFILAGAPR